MCSFVSKSSNVDGTSSVIINASFLGIQVADGFVVIVSLEMCWFHHQSSADGLSKWSEKMSGALIFPVVTCP